MIFSITGKVVGGKHIGTQLGFPTANIEPEGEYSLPENGVYAAKISIEGGKPLVCVLNQGKHPTLPEGAPTIEAFILDFSGDIYGKNVAIEYIAFIRKEKRFDSIDALKAQIASDVESVRRASAGR